MIKITVESEITLKLTEGEALALQAIACYGVDSFLKFFYEKMGTSYLKRQEEHVKPLFDKAREAGRIAVNAAEIRKKCQQLIKDETSGKHE